MNGVIAIMVTFRARSDVLENVALLVRQVESLIVIDNGSGWNGIPEIREIAQREAIELIESESNLGIATALNLGAERARQRGGRWLLLLDQDSTVYPDFVSTMLKSYSDDGNQQSVGMVFPTHLDRETQEQLPIELDRAGQPLIAITSGTLLPMSVFEVCGGFDDGFVIDAVDKEYCLRLLTMGYRLLHSRDATMLHTIGNPRTHRVLGRWQFHATHHSVARRYYMVRNNLVLIRRFHRHYPQLCLRTFLHLVKTTAKAVLFEEQKLRKMAATIRGVLDAFRGNMGKVVPL